MYDRWSLREIRLQSHFSSISRLRFAEQESRSLLIRTQCSSLKSGPQLTRKSERLRHPTGRASALCRTFEMTHVYDAYLGSPSTCAIAIIRAWAKHRKTAFTATILLLILLNTSSDRPFVFFSWFAIANRNYNMVQMNLQAVGQTKSSIALNYLREYGTN